MVHLIELFLLSGGAKKYKFFRPSTKFIQKLKIFTCFINYYALFDNIIRQMMNN
ncbi:MAG: hypothetical protein ACI9XO_004141 [Paraglaciecola sp.]|jgi:hypothetical protein